MPRATVIVPTHSHAATLPVSVRTALSQTEPDIEVVVLGDGVDEPTRAAAQALAEDDRVRFVDNPKGEGHGFEHRHQAVVTARSNHVFWLADDDLWFPDHIERLRELLGRAHLAVSLVVGVTPGGGVRVKPLDLGLPAHREALAAGERFMPMTALAHRRKAYLRLPHGWRVGGTNYRGVWAQFAQQPKMVTASLLAPTALHLASNAREEMPPEQRAAELERWSAVLADEELRRRFLEEVVAHLVTKGWLEPAQAAKARRGKAASRSEGTTSSRETGQGTPSAGSSNATPSSSSASQ